MDTMSESGFKLSSFSKLNLGSLYRNRRKPRSQSININPLNAIDTNLSIDGAMFFLSNSNGLCGNLSFTKKSILFELGKDINESQIDAVKEMKLVPKCPIKDEDFRENYEIDFLNIGDVNTAVSNDLLTIFIFCRDFRHVKILLKQGEKANLVVDKIKTISFENIIQANTDNRVCLWEYLFNNYQFRYMSDWVAHEQWYIKNFKIRFSSFNEIGQCSTLPETVIVPRNVLDNVLERFSSISNGNRVPVITFLNRTSGHMIVRSTSFKDHDFQELFSRNIVSPMRELTIDQIFIELNDIDKFYAKLRKYCFKVTRFSDSSLPSHYDTDHAKTFWSKCSPWLYSLSKVLKFTANLVNIVKNEASIGLIETFDSRFNCILSSLVQIIIDPHRRTISGFECLMSKEWIYLSGYKSRLQNSPKYRVTQCPNTTLFVLFLDLVHQLIVQNPTSFEFTTLYLISLMDLQFMTENYRREMATRFDASKSHSCIRNPLYAYTEKDPQIHAHITNIRFFSTLFFRHIKSDILKFTPEEGIFWSELNKRTLI